MLKISTFTYHPRLAVFATSAMDYAVHAPKHPDDVFVYLSYGLEGDAA